MDPNTLFERIAAGLSRDRAVTESRMFDARVLKVSAKVFAMLVKGALVIKLPPERVSRLLAEGRGQAFDLGRIMKAWISIPQDRRGTWAALAEEARESVAVASTAGSDRRRSRSRKR